MSFLIDVADLSSIVVGPEVTNVGLLAWHGGRVLDPIIPFRDSPSDPWQIRDGGDKLTEYRMRGFETIIVHDDSS